MPVEVSAVIGAIVKVASGPAKKKLSRSEQVIRVLRLLKLDPKHPADDFDTVYAHALVEYGVYQPESTLEFFRHDFIREAFRNSFYADDPGILAKEVDEVLRWNVESGAIGPVNFDPHVEVAEFTEAFIAVAGRARKPSDVLHDQKIDGVASDVRGVDTKLDRLAEMVTAQKPIIQVVRSTPFEDLTRNVRDWLSALGRTFEPYTVTTASSVEWIINIPGWREFVRVFVRVIEGEAEVADVAALDDSVRQHGTNEGWLITSIRKSTAACAEVEKPENATRLFCYTFDELIDLHVDFTGYLNWLDGEIKDRRIHEFYVPLSCAKTEFDPVSGREVAKSHYGVEDGGIDRYIARWIDDSSKAHLSILGEFGSGKTWCALHYAWEAANAYRQATEHGMRRPRLPLLIPLRDYAKAVSVESLFSEFFFRKHQLGIPNYPAFEVLNRMGRLVLIFDGFDEMANQVDRQRMINNFWELAKVVVPGSKAILTCRTEHFPHAIEGRKLLNAELRASTAAIGAESPRFEVLELQPLDEEQIREVLGRHTTEAVIATIERYQPLMELATRPLMIELILEALPEIEAGQQIDIARIYLYAFRRKMERDISDTRTFTSMADKLYFLCELSWEMLVSDEMSINYRAFPDRLRQLFGPEVAAERDLDHWQADMRGQTLLVRNSDGDYSPFHRSMLEFFAAYKLAALLGILSDDFADLARGDGDSAEPEPRAWSEYFSSEARQARRNHHDGQLSHFAADTVERLEKLVPDLEITPALMTLFVPMVDRSVATEDTLLNHVARLRGKRGSSTAQLCQRLIGVLWRIFPDTTQGIDLADQDLTGFRLNLYPFSFGEELREPNFTGADFSGSALVGAILTGYRLCSANFQNADLTNFLLSSGAFMNCLTDQREGRLVVGTWQETIAFELRDGLPWRVQARNRHRQYGKGIVFRHATDEARFFSAAWGGIRILDAHSLDLVHSYRFDGDTEQPLDEPELPVMGGYVCFAMSSKQDLLFIGNDDDRIHVWDLATMQERSVFETEDTPISLTVSSDQRYLVCSGTQSVRCWDLDNMSLFAAESWYQRESFNDPAKDWLLTSDTHLMGRDDEIYESGNYGNAVFIPDTHDVMIVSPTGEILFLAAPGLQLVSRFRPTVSEDEDDEIFYAHLAVVNEDGTLFCLAGSRSLKLCEMKKSSSPTTITCRWTFEFEVDPDGDPSRPFNWAYEEVNDIAFGHDDDFVYVVTPSGIMTFEAISGKLLGQLESMPDLTGSIFTGAIGIEPEYARQMQIYGGIF